MYSKVDLIHFLRPVVEVNDDIQDYVSEHGENVPTKLMKLLSDLDFAIRNFGEEE